MNDDKPWEKKQMEYDRSWFPSLTQDNLHVLRAIEADMRVGLKVVGIFFKDTNQNEHGYHQEKS